MQPQRPPEGEYPDDLVIGAPASFSPATRTPWDDGPPDDLVIGAFADYVPPLETDYEYEDDGWASFEGATAQAPASHRKHLLFDITREFLETAILAVLVFLMVKAAFGTYVVQGHSMDPTLDNGEFLLVSRLHYAAIRGSKWLPGLEDQYIVGPPQRGDVVVVLQHSALGGDRDLVKRVVGLPGETVEINNGHVYINGRLLFEPYITTEWSGTKPVLRLNDNEYYVLGDNRNNSSDSRMFGAISEELIQGRVIGSPWPPANFGTDLGLRPTLAADATR